MAIQTYGIIKINIVIKKNIAMQVVFMAIVNILLIITIIIIVII